MGRGRRHCYLKGLIIRVHYEGLLFPLCYLTVHLWRWAFVEVVNRSHPLQRYLQDMPSTLQRYLQDMPSTLHSAVNTDHRLRCSDLSDGS
jgi:hypothetical protein